MKRSLSHQVCTWLLALLGLFWTAAHLTACHTVEGAGEDIESAGEGISDAARDAKD